MPTIALDPRATTEPSSARRGIGRFVSGLYAALCEHAPAEVKVVWAMEPAADLDVWVASCPLHHCPWPLAVRGTRMVALWYDCCPDAAPQTCPYGSRQRVAYDSVIHSLGHYSAVLTLSRHARADLLQRHKLDPHRIHAIGADVEPIFRMASTPTERLDDITMSESLAGRGEFVLCVGGIDPRKGSDRLAQAWSLVPDGLRAGRKLVYAYKCSEAHRERVQAHCFLASAVPSLVFTGHVSDRELVALYRRALCVVYPSTYEGFGLPVLEAMRCGAAVIAGDNTSQPEVLAGSGLMVDASSPLAIAMALANVLADESYREEIAAGCYQAARVHSWQCVAERFFAAVVPAPILSGVTS